MSVKYGILLLVLVLLLSACAGNGNNRNGEATPAATIGAGPVENEQAMTPASKVDPGETPVIEGVPAPTEGANATSGGVGDVPVSPAGEAEVITAPMLAGTLLGYDVAGPEGEVGDVTGLVADLVTGQVRSISLQTVGPNPERSILLPWGTLQIVVFPVGTNPSGAEPAPQVWLDAAADVAGAPEFDESSFGNPADLIAGWDSESFAYWSERIPGLPATGGEERTEGITYLRNERFNQIEFDLVDTAGEELGEIKDFVIGEGGIITFGILDPQAALSENRDLVVVGWKAMSWIPEEGRFVLNLPVDRLNGAPHFSPADLPDTTLPGWDADWMEYWQDASTNTGGAVATPTEEGTRLPVSSGTLLEKPMVDREGKELGQLVDWWMDLQGQSEYAILQEQGRLVLLPWMALDWDVEEEQMVLNMDPHLLKDAPSFVNVTDMDEDTEWHDAADLYWQEFLPVADDTAATAPAAPIVTREDVRIMRIIEGPVFGPSGEDLGEVGDIVFNPEGQVSYIAIRRGDIIRLVPWMDFEYSMKDSRLRYLDDLARLNEAPSAESMDAYNLSAADWDADLRMYWGMK